ncbi:MAG: hypothetical protein J7K15_14370 [Deltaproteobacteria bacterium]|nr:hypothetical protein [Deltaproteobacteria bacterium]
MILNKRMDPGKEILTEVNETGGVAIAAHPCRKVRPTKEIIEKGHDIPLIHGFRQEAMGVFTRWGT